MLGQPLFIPAPPELLVILGVVIVLFGIQKLPELTNAIGRSGGELKKGREETRKELEELRED